LKSQQINKISGRADRNWYWLLTTKLKLNKVLKQIKI